MTDLWKLWNFLIGHFLSENLKRAYLHDDVDSVNNDCKVNV